MDHLTAADVKRMKETMAKLAFLIVDDRRRRSLYCHGFLMATELLKDRYGALPGSGSSP